MDNSFGKNIIPGDDKQRIDALRRYKILDTNGEESFDNIGKLATQIFKVPISLISLVDENRVFFKTNIGMGKQREVPRGVSLCSLSILDPEVTVFENAAIEPCLLTNPNVAGELGLRFYAGAPLTTHDGYRIGTICIIDKAPREFSESDRILLEGLAKIVMDTIELRLSSLQEISSQIHNRQQIEAIEERGRLAIESSNIGTYDINLLTDEIIASDRFKQIFGLDGDASREQLISRYHPDDLHIRNEALKESLINGSSSYQIRLLKNGVITWVRCNGTVFFNEEKKPIRMLGTVLDITSHIAIQHQKDDFLTIASHELKTPLTSIKAYTQILAEFIRKGDQDTSLNLLKRAERQVDKMTKLIFNFLNISKLESAQLELDLQNFDLNDLVAESINFHNAPEKKERILFERNTIPLVKADRSKLGQVLDNYISNALKYSNDSMPVLVKTICENGYIIVSVKDHGKGINATSQEKIFQRFYRADNVKDGRSSGFGIGLYFSAQVLKMHQGKTWFESVEGKGSTFYFNLPVEKANA